MATEAQIQWARFPLIASHSHARVWLQIQANLGLARNTIEAYGRALEDYLKFSSNSSINIEAATQEHISQYVHHLTNKPQLSEPNVRRIDSKAGLANATIQQRLTAVRLYYDYLVEEGIRKTNPVGRGKYTPGKGFAGNRERSLFRWYTKLPWIPNEEQWLQIVQAMRPASKAGYLSALRAFFKEIQEWEWIERRFDPRRSFAIPRNLLAQLKPNPRVISDDAWFKLLNAGLNLIQADLPQATFHKGSIPTPLRW